MLWDISDACGLRFEVVTRRPKPFRASRTANLDDPIRYAPPNDEYNTYYITEYYERGFTEAGSLVFRSLWVGMLEGSSITFREHHELEKDLAYEEWEWDRKPSFLREFDKWWEWRLHVNGVKRVRVL